MANQPPQKNLSKRIGTSMAHTALGATPNGVNKTPGTGGLADKLIGSLGYKKGGHKGGFPMPSPGMHGMGAHVPGVGTNAGMHSPSGYFGIKSPRLGSYSGSPGPTAPSGGVPRPIGGMVGGSGSGGGDDSIHAGRTMPARPSAPLLSRKTSPFQR